MKLFDGLSIECLAKADYAKTGQEWVLFLKPATLRKATKRLYDQGYFLEDICALDSTDGILLVYHFDSMVKPGRITFKVLTSREEPKVPTISDIFHGANWHERETYDFHGVDFEGHPDLIPLLLPAEEDQRIDPPLLKSDKTRSGLKSIMSLYETESCSGAVQALFADDPAEETPAAG
ncbi:MAG: NADH-quinone oxidoreductase subunit C [Desulfovibrionaceae bacterium]